jgi:hypothetical protein
LTPEIKSRTTYAPVRNESDVLGEEEEGILDRSYPQTAKRIPTQFILSRIIKIDFNTGSGKGENQKVRKTWNGHFSDEIVGRYLGIG